MDDWTYCVNTLPKVSRTFALNISVLRGELYRSVLTAYLFCRTIDTIEDAAHLEGSAKARLLRDFSKLLEEAGPRETALEAWLQRCEGVDGSPNDLDLLKNIPRVFRVFDGLKPDHRNSIIPSVSRMAKGMAYFQGRARTGMLVPLENENELEEYCYFVAGAVGEMLCNLFLAEMPSISDQSRQIMKNTAVSFGLGLQMTNISKDVVVDRKRGWSYIPKSFILEKGLSMDDFHSEAFLKKNLQILEKLLHKTTGHLHDALRFTLAIPRNQVSIRLFCIWPLWMAMETVAVLHNNEKLLTSNAPVKISRATVKRILWTTPWFAYSNLLLKRSFSNILKTNRLDDPPSFNLENLKKRLNRIPLDSTPSDAKIA